MPVIGRAEGDLRPPWTAAAAAANSAVAASKGAAAARLAASRRLHRSGPGLQLPGLDLRAGAIDTAAASQQHETPAPSAPALRKRHPGGSQVQTAAALQASPAEGVWGLKWWVLPVTQPWFHHGTSFRFPNEINRTYKYPILYFQ